MSKRELSSLSGIADVEGSRRKRRRDGLPSAFSDVDALMSEPEAEAPWLSEGNGVKEVQSVKEQGLELWLTVKDAKSKE
jgi:chromatin structure-remodeling complex subunit RSC4